MKKQITIFFASAVIFLLSTPAHAQENNLKIYNIKASIPPSEYSASYTEKSIGQENHSITLDNQSRTYHSYAPPQKENKARPVILLLHGAKRTGLSMIDKWKTIADQHNLILIAPNTAGAAWNLQVDGTPFLLAVMNDASKQYKMDLSRVYLFGHSSGASMSLYVASIHADIFAAASLHAGKFIIPEHEKFVDHAKKKIPVAFFVGEYDHLFPLDQVKSSAKAFSTRDHPTTLYVINNHNHWYYDIANDINEKAWNFMSKYTLTKN